MDFLTESKVKATRALQNLKELELSFKGNAEISLHKKGCLDAPKAKAEVIEDGVTVSVCDLVLAGVAVVSAGVALSLLRDLFD